MTYRERPIIGIRVFAATNMPNVPDFLDAANNLLRLVSEVDIALSGEYVRTTDWALKQLACSSPAVLAMEPVVREGQTDNRGSIVDATISGIASLKDSDGRPTYFSDQALASTRRLVSTLGERVSRIEIFSDYDTVDCTESIAAHIRSILRPGREILGSIEGRLEAMNSHQGFKFSIYEPVLGTRIECELSTDVEPELRQLIISMYEMRVRASGILRTNAKGEVRSAKVDFIESLRTEPRFRQASHIAALYDITGGIDAAEYVRSMRDA